MIKTLKNIYFYFNIWSIDVAFGVWCMGQFAKTICESDMPLAWEFLLPLSVWCIYTMDHLQDAITAKSKFLSTRHFYHLKYQKTVRFILYVMVFISACVAILFLPIKLFIIGLLLSIITFFYYMYIFFYTHHKFPKEIFVAVIYTLGIWYAPLVYAQNITFKIELSMLLHFQISVFNLLLFSYLTLEEDKKSNFKSIAIQLGENEIKKYMYFLIISIMILCCIIFFFDYKLGLIFMIMNLILGLILINKNYFMIDNRYRFVGDAIFYLGLIYLI